MLQRYKKLLNRFSSFVHFKKKNPILLLNLMLIYFYNEYDVLCIF